MEEGWPPKRRSQAAGNMTPWRAGTQSWALLWANDFTARDSASAATKQRRLPPEVVFRLASADTRLRLHVTSRHHHIPTKKQAQNIEGT